MHRLRTYLHAMARGLFHDLLASRRELQARLELAHDRRDETWIALQLANARIRGLEADVARLHARIVDEKCNAVARQMTRGN